MVIAASNPVHSVLYLILAFVNAAGLFVMLGAEFLAMILIVVYVGAVAVLFLFVVMMLDVDFAELRQGFLQYLPIGALLVVIFAGWSLCSVVFGWAHRPGHLAVDRLADPAARQRQQYRGARPGALHALRLFLPGRRPGSAGRHGGRHRADAAPQPNVKRQNIAEQVARTKATAIEVVKVRAGRGCHDHRARHTISPSPRSCSRSASSASSSTARTSSSS